MSLTFFNVISFLFSLTPVTHVQVNFIQGISVFV